MRVDRAQGHEQLNDKLTPCFSSSPIGFLGGQNTRRNKTQGGAKNREEQKIGSSKKQQGAKKGGAKNRKEKKQGGAKNRKKQKIAKRKKQQGAKKLGRAKNSKEQ